MEQGSRGFKAATTGAGPAGGQMYIKVCIIGAGPAGCMAAYFLQDKCDVTMFDFGEPLRTLLPTGGGRCNLAHAEYDFKELAKNYPRGEKFLYSVFSRFATADTVEFFEKLGVKTYTQDDGRIFPVSNSAKDVREKFLKALQRVRFVKERVCALPPGFDKYIISIGGHASYDMIKSLGHKIIEPRPALAGLLTKEDLSDLAGVSIGGLLFTHKGISGPEAYRISSIRARESFPYKVSFDLCKEMDLQALLNANPHKSIKNLLAEFIPKSLAVYILNNLQDYQPPPHPVPLPPEVNPAGEGEPNLQDEKCHKIDGKMRDAILERLHNFELTIAGTAKEGEVVTSGGVCLDEVNPKTLES
ncbi:MAG: NAD(P)/FAD-dependent oxidoreductase, partial [Heliobacteriaceae bacterium]|nr:NAD(P)/FAD-dependent oxidoreductase [Heliobacteriaceae bacterium]